MSLNGFDIEYGLVNISPNKVRIYFDINHETFKLANSFERERFVCNGMPVETWDDVIKQRHFWDVDAGLDRKQAIEELLWRLEATDLEFDVVYLKPNEFRFQFNTDQERFEELHAMEDSFREMGFEFRITEDDVNQARSWILDSSFLVAGSPPKIQDIFAPLRVTRIQKPQKQILYHAGDVIQVPLLDEIHKGYMRMLIDDAPPVLIECYKVVSEDDLPLDAFQNADWLTKNWYKDFILSFNGCPEYAPYRWKVIGNIPVNDVYMPLFWEHKHKREVRFSKYPFPSDLGGRFGRIGSEEDIQRLRAQTRYILEPKTLAFELDKQLIKEKLYVPSRWKWDYSDVQNCLLNNNYSHAAELCRKVLAIKPDYVRAWNDLSVSLTNMGSFLDALKAARRAILLAPKGGIFWTTFGEALEAMGNVDGAIRVYRKALSIQPNEKFAIDHLANLKHKD